MLDVNYVARYLRRRYREEQKVELDEIKLNKLLYFSQLECISRSGKPMFKADFEAKKYGPAVSELSGSAEEAQNCITPYLDYFDYVFKLYAEKDTWTLSEISHGESCWQKAREQEGHKMSFEDIKKDADLVKIRRWYFPH